MIYFACRSRKKNLINLLLIFYLLAAKKNCSNSLKIKKKKWQSITIWIYRYNNFESNSKNEKSISFIKSFFVVIFVRKFFLPILNYFLWLILTYNILNFIWLTNEKDICINFYVLWINNISNLITYNISFRVLYSRIHRCVIVFTRAESLKINGVTCSNNLLDV